MLHKKRVFLALYYSARRWLRVNLRLKPTPRPPPVLGQPLEKIVERHAGIAVTFLDNLPPQVDLREKHFCEVGPGDCLAMASLALGMGASRVDMVENSLPVVSEKQVQVLRVLKDKGLPMDLSIIRDGSPPCLDAQRVVYHHCYMEQFDSRGDFDRIFSHAVVEHVEDLQGFHKACWKALKHGGWVLHVVDLGGHSEFEDPIPPLDFQTYPDWLFDWMYPRYHRATRTFLSEHQNAAAQAGFLLKQSKPLRTVDQTYIQTLWPNLRPAARACSPEELAVIEVAILGRKP